MAVQFVGVERRQGTYEGKPYDNHIAHFVVDEPTPNLVAGRTVMSKRIRTSDWPLVVDQTIQPGDEVQVFYNQYGNITKIAKVQQK